MGQERPNGVERTGEGAREVKHAEERVMWHAAAACLLEWPVKRPCAIVGYYSWLVVLSLRHGDQRGKVGLRLSKHGTAGRTLTSSGVLDTLLLHLAGLRHMGICVKAAGLWSGHFGGAPPALLRYRRDGLGRGSRWAFA